MRITFDFHGFVQQHTVLKMRRGDRVAVPLTPVLRRDGDDDEWPPRFVTFEALGDRWVCAGCYLCSPKTRHRELIKPAVKAAVRAERLRVRRLRARTSKARRA